MPSESKPLQLDEVTAFVPHAKENACAIVHTGSGREASLFPDGKGWLVRASLKQAPTPVEIKAFKGLKLAPNTRELVMRFGPQAGKTITLHLVSGTFKTLEAAAAAGLALVRLLVGEPEAWLWIAPEQYDSRGQPPTPPAPWPPRSD